MKNIYILILATAVCFSACRVKEGEVGLPGESALNKQGSVSGTLHYYTSSGDTAIVPFSYEYFPSAQQSEFFYNQQGSYKFYNMYLSRQEAKEDGSYIELSVEGEGLDALANQPVKPQYPKLYFSLTKVIDGKLFIFQTDYTLMLNDGYSTSDITNFKLDTASGRLTFDYKFTIHPYDMDNNGYLNQDEPNTPAIIIGKVDVVLPRSYYGSIYGSVKNASAL